jgi:hypothetical protein
MQNGGSRQLRLPVAIPKKEKDQLTVDAHDCVPVFVVGEYTPGAGGFDARIVGVYNGIDLMFAARVRAGFVPATRRDVFTQIRHLKTAKCPFANLPEKSEGRWGKG